MEHINVDKENLSVILTMKADAKSYHNEKNVWDCWRKTQRMEIWSDQRISELPREPIDIFNHKYIQICLFVLWYICSEDKLTGWQYLQYRTDKGDYHEKHKCTILNYM